MNHPSSFVVTLIYKFIHFHHNHNKCVLHLVNRVDHPWSTAVRLASIISLPVSSGCPSQCNGFVAVVRVELTVSANARSPSFPSFIWPYRVSSSPSDELRIVL